MMLPNLEDETAKSETFLLSYLKQFLSTLLVVPDNPEVGVLSLLRTLLNVVRRLDWNKQNCNLATLYTSVVDLLSVMAQEDYPYHVDRGRLVQRCTNSEHIIVSLLVRFVQAVRDCQRLSWTPEALCFVLVAMFCVLIRAAPTSLRP